MGNGSRYVIEVEWTGDPEADALGGAVVEALLGELPAALMDAGVGNISIGSTLDRPICRVCNR